MPIRLVITVTTKPGKGDEVLADLLNRNAGVQSEPGCEEFEVSRSIGNPDRFVVIERWTDQALLNAHAERIKGRPTLTADLRLESRREDYEYNRTR